MAITRIWFFTLKPNISPTSPAFLDLWAEILDLCASYTPTPSASTSQVHVAHISTPVPKRPHHFLFSTSQQQQQQQQDQQPQDSSATTTTTNTKTPLLFVLISTYPSFALCSQADAVYKMKFQPRLADMVDHLALRQMDMEETETIPALLAASSAAARNKGVGGGGGGDGGGDGGGGITVTLSTRDPLRIEVEGAAMGGTQTPVPSLDQEVSGADVYTVPPAPVLAPVLNGETNGNGEVPKKKDIFKTQREEQGRRWIRITRGWDVKSQVGEEEVFKLKEVITR